MTSQCELIQKLVCPRTHSSLKVNEGILVSDSGAKYFMADDTPVMLLDDIEQSMGLVENSLRRVRGENGDVRAPELYLESLGLAEEEKQGIVDLYRSGNCKIDPVVSFLVGATNGIGYKHLVGKLCEYPIPELPLPPSNGASFLDIGCNWGRWCISAKRLGYAPIGIDPSLGAIMAAKRVAKQLELPLEYVVGDARHLPFKENSFDVVFSYSVLQHFSTQDAVRVMSEIGRVLKPNGHSVIQMPNKWGARCLQHQIRRGFREAKDFEVRYWSIGDLREEFVKAIGKTSVFVDCFLGLGLQKSDIALMPAYKRPLIHFSELLKRMSKKLSFLIDVADSVFVESWKPAK